MQENAEFTFKLGIVDGQVITVEEVKQLATMPSKEADLLQAAVPHQRPGPAPGHGDERRRPRSGRGGQPGASKRANLPRRRASKARSSAEAAPVAPQRRPWPKQQPAEAPAPRQKPWHAAPSKPKSTPKCRRPLHARPRQPGRAKIRKQQRRLPKRRPRAKQALIRARLSRAVSVRDPGLGISETSQGVEAKTESSLQ